MLLVTSVIAVLAVWWVGTEARVQRAENERTCGQQEARKRRGEGKLGSNLRKTWGMTLECTDGPLLIMV